MAGNSILSYQSEPDRIVPITYSTRLRIPRVLNQLFVKKEIIPIAFIKWPEDARLFFIKTIKKIVA
jgi:hypothetical protein